VKIQTLCTFCEQVGRRGKDYKQTNKQTNKQTYMSVVITEEYNVMVKSEELMGRTEYLTL
jgi:hypothetical protein